MIQAMDKNVVRVTVLKHDAQGNRVAVPVYDEATASSNEPRKKQSWMLKGAEKRHRKGVTRIIRLLGHYQTLHERSNRKKKNGWARDYFKNSVKAVKKVLDS